MIIGSRAGQPWSEFRVMKVISLSGNPYRFRDSTKWVARCLFNNRGMTGASSVFTDSNRFQADEMLMPATNWQSLPVLLR